MFTYKWKTGSPARSEQSIRILKTTHINPAEVPFSIKPSRTSSNDQQGDEELCVIVM